MSPPDTNIEKQTRRHRGPLLGIVAAVAFAAIAFLVYLIFIADSDPALDELRGTAEPDAIESTVGDQ